MNYCPNNTLTHYTTKFPKITDLDGTWEIGLAEIQSIFFNFHIDLMIDFIETHVEFILEFLYVLFPLDGESFWPRNSTHPVTRPNAFVVIVLGDLWKDDSKFGGRIFVSGTRHVHGYRS
jgi:hypothetical protein